MLRGKKREKKRDKERRKTSAAFQPGFLRFEKKKEEKLRRPTWGKEVSKNGTVEGYPFFFFCHRLGSGCLLKKKERGRGKLSKKERAKSVLLSVSRRREGDLKNHKKLRGKRKTKKNGPGPKVKSVRIVYYLKKKEEPRNHCNGNKGGRKERKTGLRALRWANVVRSF